MARKGSKTWKNRHPDVEEKPKKSIKDAVLPKRKKKGE